MPNMLSFCCLCSCTCLSTSCYLWCWLVLLFLTGACQSSEHMSLVVSELLWSYMYQYSLETNYLQAGLGCRELWHRVSSQESMETTSLKDLTALLPLPFPLNTVLPHFCKPIKTNLYCPNIIYCAIFHWSTINVPGDFILTETVSSYPSSYQFLKAQLLMGLYSKSCLHSGFGSAWAFLGL